MSEELEAFRRWTNACLSATMPSWYSLEQAKIDKHTIETALKDYERRLKLAKDYEDVNNVAKRLKAFDIIKNTRVDTNLIKKSKDYDDYCSLEAAKLLTENVAPTQRGITEEEYDLLKEVLL